MHARPDPTRPDQTASDPTLFNLAVSSRGVSPLPAGASATASATTAVAAAAAAAAQDSMPLTLETVERLQKLLEEERQRILSAQATQVAAASTEGMMRAPGPVVAKGIGGFVVTFSGTTFRARRGAWRRAERLFLFYCLALLCDAMRCPFVRGEERGGGGSAFFLSTVLPCSALLSSALPCPPLLCSALLCSALLCTRPLFRSYSRAR